MIRALVTIGFLQFLSMLLLLARTKILAVTVGPEGVGAMSAIDRLTMLISQTLALSLPFASLRFLPATLRESPVEADLLYRRMRFVLFTLFVPVAVVCAAIALLAPTLWGAALLPYQRTLMLAFVALPVTGIVPFLTNAFAGLSGHVQSMRFTIAHTLVLVASALAAMTRFGIDAFYATYAVLGSVLILVAAPTIHAPGVAPDAAKHRVSITDAFRLPPALWRFTAWMLPLTFATPYAAWYVQYSTLKLYGADATGILQGAIGISLSIRALLGAAHGIFLTPNVNLQATSSERMAWANEFQRSLVLLLTATVPPLLLFSDIALRVLYAAPFVAATPFVALFVGAEVVNMLSGTYQALIIAGDRVGFHVIQNLTAQLLLAGVAALAVPRLGLAGAGIAVLVAPVFMFITTIVFLRSAFSVRVSREAARMATLVIALLISSGLVGSSFPGLTAGVLSAKAGLCAALWLFVYAAMPAEDRGRLRVGLMRVKAAGISRWARGGGVA